MALWACTLVPAASSQELTVGGTPAGREPFCPADTDLFTVGGRITHGLDYSLSCSGLHFINRKQGDQSNTVSLLHQLRYRWQIENQGTLTFSGTFTHDLGVLWFPDSLVRFQPDENALDTRAAFQWGRTVSLSFQSRLATPLFNRYSAPAHDPGRVLTGAFLTPLTWNFSAGIGWTLPGFGVVDAGVSSAKFTWVRNRHVYRGEEPDAFCGVAPGQGHSFEYGLSAHLAIDREFASRFHWTCDLLVFRNFRRPADLTMKNTLTATINGFLRATLQSSIIYEHDSAKQLQSETLISLRFCTGL